MRWRSGRYVLVSSNLRFYVLTSSSEEEQYPGRAAMSTKLTVDLDSTQPVLVAGAPHCSRLRHPEYGPEPSVSHERRTQDIEPGVTGISHLLLKLPNPNPNCGTRPTGGKSGLWHNCIISSLLSIGMNSIRLSKPSSKAEERSRLWIRCRWHKERVH